MPRAGAPKGSSRSLADKSVPLTAGAFIPVVLGLVSIEANSGQLQREWQVVVQPVGALAAVALIIAIARARRAAGSEQAAAGRLAFRRGYRVIVATEVAALLAGLIVNNAVFGVHELSVHAPARNLDAFRADQDATADHEDGDPYDG